MTELTDAEIAHITSTAERIEAFVGTEKHPTYDRSKAPGIFAALVRMQGMGIVPRGPIAAMLEDRRITNEMLSYAEGAAAFEAQEDDMQSEFQIALHVTHDLILLSAADRLALAFGVRPVSLSEFDARIAAWEAESEGDG